MRLTIIKSKIIVSIFLLAFPIINTFSQTPVRILCLGNSITEGWTDGTLTEGQRRSYRFGLKYLLQSAGYNVNFVGSQENGCDYFSDCQHAGIGGSRDQYVERLLIDGYDLKNGEQIINPPGPYLDYYNPDIILLHIGTNDITHEATPWAPGTERISAILDLIDDYEARAGKEVTVFFALIVNRRMGVTGRYNTSYFNDQMEILVQDRIDNQNDKIVIVDMENDAGFVYNDEDITSTDPEGIHPNQTGYDKMAALWFTAITEHFNTPPEITPIPDQSMVEGTSFTDIILDNYVSDIEDSDENITWSYNQLSGSQLNITIDANRIMHIEPINPAWNGTQLVELKALDNGINGNFKKSDKDTVAFTVTPYDYPPTIIGQTAISTVEDTPVELLLEEFTVSDPDSDPSSFELVVLEGENYSIVANNTIQPATNYDQDINVNVAVSDESGQGDVYSALINITPVNDSPVITGQSGITIDEDNYYILNINDIDVTDPDNDLSELSFSIRSGSNYSYANDTIFPNSNFNGVLTVPIKVIDPLGAQSNEYNLNININPVNDPPVLLVMPSDTAVVGEFYIYVIQAEDPDNEDFTCNVVANPSWLPYSSSTKSFIGIPEVSDIGIDQISFSLTDGKSVLNENFYIHVISPTAIETKYINDKLNFFPNPASDHISITGINKAGKLTFMIHDLCGRVLEIYSIDYDGISTLTFNLSNLEKGIYIGILEMDNQIYSNKLIIE